jgi:transposase
MPGSTIIEIPEATQALMLKELRSARYGFLLTIHILLLCAAGKNPTEIAEFLFCSRSSIYRTVRAFRRGELDADLFPKRIVINEKPQLPNRFQRTLRWLVQQPPRACGWVRTRWSCATLALSITARTKLVVSRETVRRELHAQGYVWKRAKLKAKDDDPERARRLALIRHTIEHLGQDEAFFWVDELDIHLLAKVGYQWMLKGTETEIPTPGPQPEAISGRSARPAHRRDHLCRRRAQDQCAVPSTARPAQNSLWPTGQAHLSGGRQLHHPQGESRRAVVGAPSALRDSVAAEILSEG